MQFKQCKWTFRSLRSLKDHLRAHCKPAYQRQNKDHYKDKFTYIYAGVWQCKRTFHLQAHFKNRLRSIARQHICEMF
jgi:hypothetical protein